MMQPKITIAAMYLQILATWENKPLIEGCRWVYFNIFDGVDNRLVHRFVHGLVHMVVGCFSIWSVGQLKKLHTHVQIQKCNNKVINLHRTKIIEAKHKAKKSFR
jgi:hypothetical protein